MKIILWLVFTSFNATAQQYAIATIAGGPSIPAPVAALAASIGEPAAVAVASNGDAYFTNGTATLYKVDTRGVLTRVAGLGRSGDSDLSGGLQIGKISATAADLSGNIYMADATFHRILKLTPGGALTTIAGSGRTAGYSGDNGPAIDAQLATPAALALDTAGNLYIADRDNYRVRRIGVNGLITSVAGNGTTGYSGDGGAALSAQLSNVAGIAIDASNNLYIADLGNNRIRKVTNGLIATAAGNGSSGYSGDNGAATAAQLSSPTGVTVDYAGTLFITDSNNNRVRRVSTSGVITSVAGNGLPGAMGEGGPAATAQLNNPTGIAVDSLGNLFVADQFNFRIRKITTTGSIISIAGNGSRSYSVNGGAAIGAQLDQPRGLAIDAAGNLYIADGRNFRVRKVTPNGIITTVAGNGTSGYSGDNGPATDAQLAYQLGVAVSPSGDLFIADSFNHRVRKVAPNGIITTVVGNGTPGYSGDGGPATSATINNINGVTVDAAGNLYIADYGNFRIRKVFTNGIITTLADTGVSGYSGDGGPAINAQISTVWGMATDTSNNLFIADYLNHRIRRITPGGVITTIAGSGSRGSSGDGGPAISAQLAYPVGSTVDSSGNLYLVDSDNYTIRKVSASGVITTIAGTGVRGFAGDGGRATNGQIGATWGLVVDAAGNVYLADSDNNAIRVLKPTAALLAVSAVVNAASNQGSSIAPGEIVVLYGSGVGPSQLTRARLDVNGRYGSSLATTRVLFNGTPAPILYTSSSQVSAIVPYGINGATASIQIEYQGVRSDPLLIPIAPSAPALFTQDASGKGPAAAFNEDGSLNQANLPANAGSIIVLYATGEGLTSPASVDGQLATDIYPKPLQRVEVTIDGRSAEVLYAGAAPGIVAGLMQINARIPSATRTGDAPVLVTIGNAFSQAGVTIAVAGN